MLAELYILNFAIIDELRVRFKPGLNVLTGETGAGKSIILDAMALVLGERADTTMVRGGCEEAYVEAVFGISQVLQKSFKPILESEGLEGDQDNVIMLSRELRVNGRNICRVNGRAVSLAILRDLGDRLVDIHGQGEHLSLLKAKSHLPLLDAFSGLDQERLALSNVVARLREIRRELASLRQDEKTLAQRIDLLKYQISEIEAANLMADEERDLRIERTRLGNVEHLLQLSNVILASLNGLDEDNVSVVDQLGQAEKVISNLVNLDPTQKPLLEQLQNLVYLASDLAGTLIDYRDQLEYEPGRLDLVEERIELINRLKRKYGEDIPTILAYQESALAELESITHSEERIEQLSTEEEIMLHDIGKQALLLSEKRRSASEQLSTAVEQELTHLHMERAQFQVSFSYEEKEDGVYVDNRRLACDSTGIDRVEFLVSANPGEFPRPLAKVASGGETSRLMLALKTVLASVDATPTLIFDEIDQGIGGRVGDVVGRKLWGLTKPARHQVIVVTHLPQLAGYADGHFHVSKRLTGERITTTIQELDQEGRVEELAAMLGTRDEHAKGGAESILSQVTTFKTAN